MITTKRIKIATADFYRIPVDVLDNPGSERVHAGPRQVAMYLARKMTRLTLNQIGQKFQRHHTNVHHAMKAIRKKPWALRDADIIERALLA